MSPAYGGLGGGFDGASGAISGFGAPIMEGGAGSNPYMDILRRLQGLQGSQNGGPGAAAMRQLQALQARPLPPLPTPPGALDQYAPPTPDATAYDPGEDDPDRDYMTKVRGPESGGDDTIVNRTSGATGRFQFVQPTWDAIRKQAPDLGLDPTVSTDVGQQTRAMKFLTDQNRKALSTAIGGQPTDAQLYLAHFLGPQYAMMALKSPETPVERLFPANYIQQNPWMAGLTAGQLTDIMARKVNRPRNAQRPAQPPT